MRYCFIAGRLTPKSGQAPHMPGMRCYAQTCPAPVPASPLQSLCELGGQHSPALAIAQQKGFI